MKVTPVRLQHTSIPEVILLLRISGILGKTSQRPAVIDSLHDG